MVVRVLGLSGRALAVQARGVLGLTPGDWAAERKVSSLYCNQLQCHRHEGGLDRTTTTCHYMPLCANKLLHTLWLGEVELKHLDLVGSTLSNVT